MRVEKTIKNIKIAMLYQLTILVFTFVDKKVFLSNLGVDYAGLHGLFTNMISMLSLAELGVGIAIIYNLYQPLEKQDKQQISALMQFYKKAYYIIGIGIGIIGSILAIGLPIFIKEPIYDMEYIRRIYFIFLSGTVLTYFTGYKRSLLYADQKNYLLLIGDMTANTIGVLIKLWILLVSKSYSTYVIVHIIFKWIPNIWASYKVNQLYPYIKEVKTKLPTEKLQQIKNNVKDLFIHKMSNFVIMATDNIIISSFVGLGAVGLVASYNMIVAALTGFIAQGIEGIQASMGNLVASETKEKVEEVYDKILFASYWIASFSAVALVCLVQPFIQLWLGQDFLLDNQVVAIIILNLFLWIITRPLWQMMTVTGLFKEDKLNSLVEIGTKLIVSIVLVQQIGIIGVFIGTAITYLVAWVMKSYFLYTKFFKKPYSKSYGKLMVYILITVGQVFITYWICGKVRIENDYLRFASQMMICAILPNIINYLLFLRTKEFIYFKKLVGDMAMKALEKLRDEAVFIKIQRLVFSVIAVLLFLLPLERVELTQLTIIGKMAAVIIFGITSLYILYLLLVSNVMTHKTKKIIWIYIAGAVGLTVFSFVTEGMVGAKASIMMIFMLNTGLACSYIDYRQIGKWIYIFDVGAVVYLVVIMNHYLRLEDKSKSYSFVFNNPNYLGLVCTLMMFLCLIAYGISKGKRYLVYMLPLVWIVSLSRGRTSLLALGALIITYLLWRLITKYRGIYYAFLILIILAIILVTVFYPLLSKLPIFQELNKRMFEATGKRLFSGRQRIWLQSLDLIIKKPLLGYGMGEGLESLTEGTLSIHNIYLQLLLQGGMVLLSLFVTLISWIWRRLYLSANSNLVQIGVACLVGILVIGTFELTLLGQSISLGITQWFIMGIGCSPVLHKGETTNE